MYGLGNITVTISNTLMPKFQGLRSNGLGFVPMKSSFGNAFELEYVPISKIQTDEKNFQNRADKYSEKSVNAILKAVKNGTFNWFAFDPVLLWKNPSGDLIVLSGHSRTEAFRRLAAERPKIEIDGLSFDKIPAKIFKGDFVNAKNLALNSNALSTPETLLERADFYRNQRELLNNKSDIAKLREKAVRENQGSVIWDLSFLPADGLTVDSLKRFKMQEDSEAAFENYVRAVNIAQWIGKAFQIYKGLSRLHDSELFKFLLNNYGTKSGQYNSFAKLNERLQVLYPRNVKNVEKTDLDGNYTTPFGLVIYEKNDDEINEIQELESEAKKAKRELDKKIKDLRGRAADKAQIFEIVTPHFNEYVNKLFDWWNSLDREKVRKTDKNQGALFGCLSQMIDDYSVNDNDVLCAGLGKPTVKFEFEDNADLFNFFKSKKNNYENAQNVDFQDITQSPTTSKSKRTNLRQTAIKTPETLYLPYSEGAKALPGSSSPKALPPSTSQNIPPLSSVLKPDGVYINHRKIGDYGYINSRFKYINLFIDREYMVNDNIFKWCEKIFPHAVIIVCFQDNNNNWKFYFQRPKYKDFIYKHFSNSFIQNAGIKYFIFDLPHIEKVIQAFESEGFPVVLVYRNIVEDINDLSTQTNPKALPPATSTPEPTTQKTTAPDWGGFSKRFENASGWSSFDPERSARVNTNAYQSIYNKYVADVPADKVEAFDHFFNKKLDEIVSLRSRTASAAVTGNGGISARKAERLNAAKDRYMEKSANFESEISDFVNKLKRSARRAEFVQMSNEERSDERFNELKKVVDSIATSQENYKKYKKEPSLMPHEDYEFYLKHYNVKNKNEAIAWALNSIQYNVGLDKAGLYDQIYREYRNGNNLTVNRILDYIKGLNVFTDKHKIWKLYKAVENKPDFETSLFDKKNYEGAEIIENRELDRVQIKFSGIPSEDCRTDLKRNGFRWSPFYKVWQRKLTPQAVRVANEIVAKYYSVGLGKPTIKLEFEDNGEIFKTFGNLQGLTVNDKPAWIFNCPESMLKTNGFKPTYKRLLSYDALIDSSDGNKTLVGYGFNKSTLDELKEACKCYKQVEKLAAHLKADSEAQSAFNVWHWLHCNVNYNYDKAGEEEIRTPARTWADRKTGVDCDCLAVFTACLFICMGYRPLFEIVAFHNSPQYSHIYVNLNGLAVDRVLPVFGIRPSLITKKYLMEIPVYHLSGIDGCMNGLQGVYESTLSKIFSKTATPEDSLNFRKAQVLITLQNVDPDAYKLGAIIMPHVQAIGDDGAYYFDNEYVAKVAKQLDSDLQKRHLNGIYGLGKGWLKKAIKKVGNAVKKVAKGTANAVKTVAKATANTVKAAAKSTVNAVKATANVTKAAAQAVTGNAKKAKETLKKAATQVKAAAIAPIKQAAKDTKSVVKNAVVQPVKTVTQVTLINPIKDTVKIAGKLFKVLLVKLNPALILIRSGLKVLIAINFLGMATRFSIGLLTQAEAEQKGYDQDTWENAKKALDKIVRFWKKIGGKEDKLLKTIRNGSTRKALFKKNYNKNTKIVETGEDSATLGAVEIKILNGINGLGEGFTIGTALAAVGAFFAKIWGWIKKIVPKVGQVVKKIASSNAVQTAAQFIKGQTGKSTDTPDNSLVDHNISSDTKPNWMPWAFAAAALGVGIFAFSGKKKKKRA